MAQHSQISNLMKQRPLLALAPLAGLTDRPFRKIASQMGAHYTVTEMISSEALVRESQKTLHMLKGIEEEETTFVQLVGARPKTMARAAQMVEDLGARGIDINMGCPERRIVSQGAGAALLKDHSLAIEVVSSVAGSTRLPVTVKMRLGWTKVDVDGTVKLINGFRECGVKMVAIHARTRAQMFSGLPHWDSLCEVVKGASLPIIANGNIKDFESYKECLRATGAKGVMIGRGALGSPWVFTHIAEQGKIPLEPKTWWLARYVNKVFHHLEDILTFYGEKRAILPMRYHLTWYSKGLKGAAYFRERIGRLGTPREMLECFKALLRLNGIAI